MLFKNPLRQVLLFINKSGIFLYIPMPPARYVPTSAAVPIAVSIGNILPVSESYIVITSAPVTLAVVSAAFSERVRLITFCISGDSITSKDSCICLLGTALAILVAANIPNFSRSTRVSVHSFTKSKPTSLISGLVGSKSGPKSYLGTPLSLASAFFLTVELR